MASVIKNQLVKHLSKFAKNLSPDKIQLSTLKGEGELKNLELNEDVLMEILELPTWLRLQRAVCNRVTIKIQFSRLKSQPIRLYLDEVLVDMQTCDELRQPGSTSGLPSYSSGGRYSFGDRVVDGMYLHINSVVVSFTSRAFKAELQISRIIVQSKTPTWREASDLRHTRISEKHRDLLLTFKEVEWQTIRLEANCMVHESSSAVSAPLRFIANQAKVRISIKKRYSDCSVVASKVQLLMDDLLWVLTDSQMKAAFVFVKYVKGNVDKAAEQTKKMADRLLQKERQSQAVKPTLASPNTVLFNKFDIQESSFHFQSSRIDFHICDDINSTDPNRKRQVDGGALGIALMKLCIDHYPIRAAGSSRQHWPGYDDSMSKRDYWAQSLLGAYGDLLRQLQRTAKGGSAVAAAAAAAATATAAYSNLIERSIVLRVEDLFLTTVSLEKIDEQRPKKLLASDKKALLLPKEMSTVHVEFTEYFFAKDTGLPVPSPNIFVLVNPIVLTVDVMTILWLNSFALSLLHDVESVVQELRVHEETTKGDASAVFKLEMLMPKVVLPAFFRQPSPPAASEPVISTPSSASGLRTADANVPTALQLQLSLLTITNAFSPDTPSGSRVSTASSQRSKRDASDGALPRPDGAAELACAYSDLHLVTHSGSFPCESADEPLLRQELWNTAVGSARSVDVHNGHAPLSKSSSKLWLLTIDQAWLEFTAGLPGSACGRPASFVESVPVTVWMCLPSEPPPSTPLPPASSCSVMPRQPPSEAAGVVEQQRRIDILVKVGAKICAQLSPSQCSFMLKLADSMKSLKDDLKQELDSYLAASAPRQAPPSVELPPPTVVTLLLRVAEVEFAVVTPTTDQHLGSTVPHLPAVASSAFAYARDVASARDGHSSVCSSPPTTSDHTSRVSPIAGSYGGDDTAMDSGSITLLGNLRPDFAEAGRAAGIDSDSGMFTQSPLSSHDNLTFTNDAGNGNKVDVWQRKQPSEPALSTITPVTSLAAPAKDGRALSAVSSAGSLPPLAQAQVKVANSFAKFTSKVKAVAKTATGGDEDDESVTSDWDSLSVRSDDDGDFLFLSLDEETPAFAAVNQAGFVTEDASASDADSLYTEQRLKRPVLVVSFKICNIECGTEIKGNNATVVVAANHFVTSDLGCLPYDDFLNRHLAAQCVLEPQIAGRSVPPVAARLRVGPGIEHPQMGPLEDGFASLAIADYAFVVQQSTVDKLSSFAAALQVDSRSSKSPPMPFCIDVSNVTATVKNDEASSLASSTNVKPMLVRVSKVNVTRVPDGTISIHGDTVDRPWPVQPCPDQGTISAAPALCDRSTMTEVSEGVAKADTPGLPRPLTGIDGAHSEGAAAAPAAAGPDHSGHSDSSCGGVDSPAQQLLREMNFLRVENDDLRARLGAQDLELAALHQRLDDALTTSGAAAAAAAAVTKSGDHGAPLNGGRVRGEGAPVQQQSSEEVEGWRRRALESAAEAEEARAERDCLLKTVRLLQDELTESERRANAACAEAEAAARAGHGGERHGRGKASLHRT